MKETIFLRERLAKLIIIVILVNFSVFTWALIVALSEGRWIIALFDFLFILFSIFSYFIFRNKGIFDRARIQEKGITILRGLKNELVFVSWDQVAEIKTIKHPLPEKLRIISDVVVDGRYYTIDVEHSYETDNLISKYKGIQ